MKYCRKQSDLIGKIQHHEQVKAAERERACLDTYDRKVLLIHTGGTIGMFRDQEGKFRPEKQRFQKFLKTYPYFSDENETYFSSEDGYIITPESIFKKRILYKYFQIDELIDSTNMNLDRLNYILRLVEDNFEGEACLNQNSTPS